MTRKASALADEKEVIAEGAEANDDKRQHPALRFYSEILSLDGAPAETGFSIPEPHVATDLHPAIAVCTPEKEVADSATSLSPPRDQRTQSARHQNEYQTKAH
jgi:hypothetical protein